MKFISHRRTLLSSGLSPPPVEVNGFGWTSERTAKEVADLQERFPLLPDTPEVFNRWLELVHRLPIRGKRVHDARLVAVLQAPLIT